MSGVIAGWWNKDSRAAETYVATNIDALGPETAMMMATRLFSKDPQHATDWINQLSNVEARRSADSAIATQLSLSDPKKASEWAASLPDEVREAVMRGPISIWARNDPQAAAQWLNGLTGRVRDEAVGVYSSALAAKDPATALTWAASASSVQIQDQIMERIVAGWMRRSPNDATAWIQASTLAETQKARLLALGPKK
jgi:plasmid stabilization system protein ParE